MVIFTVVLHRYLHKTVVEFPDDIGVVLSDLKNTIMYDGFLIYEIGYKHRMKYGHSPSTLRYNGRVFYTFLVAYLL